MTPELWVEMGMRAGTQVDILDLRDDEWRTEHDVIVSRTKLPGDPRGSTECDLTQFSEFVDHRPSAAGYFGADYNRQETNWAHSNGHHRYKVSRTVIESDVFINLPKLKTHKKAGITASLKNLVGINTYKNWLPHHTEGTWRSIPIEDAESNRRRPRPRRGAASSIVTHRAWALDCAIEIDK
jgi:Domain of unknown function (DUF362)